MLIRSILAAAALALVAPLSRAQSLPYERYTLDNGLTVILHQDRTLPVAAVNIWYRVGSKDEAPGRSGFAHLFEHLMFMGTERVPGNEFDVIMESGGGSNNATTAYDRTNYFESGPSSLLPTLLWLEADRLEDLGRTMSKEKLDLQRDVVRNERRQSYENAPYGKAYLMATELMFPPGHPYRIPTIGSHADLEAATVNDVKDFFATYYVPSNMTLCVAGDFDPGAIKPLIEDLFGDLPSGSPPTPAPVPPASLTREIRLTTLDKVQLPMVSHWYHAPPIYTEGNAEIDLLAQVLAEGKSSRLYKRLVMQDQLAADVEAFQDSNLLGSILMINVYAIPGVDLARVEAAIDEELTRLASEGPTPDELEQFKSARELAMLSSMQDVLSRADSLNAYQFYFGEPDGFARDLNRYRSATAGSVLQWASRVLNPDARLITRVLPESPERGQVARDARPASAAPATWAPPTPATFTLSNGLRVMHFPKHDIPLVAMSVLLAPGSPIDDPDAPGLAALAAEMLDEGSGDLDALAFNDRVTSIGATLSITSDAESAQVAMTVIERNLAKGVSLLAAAVTRPAMEQDDWDRVKSLHMENLRQQDDNPTIVAARVSNRLLFGDASPLGRPVSGTRRSVEPLTLNDAKDRAARIFRPEQATILIAGDVSEAQARSMLEEHFGSWSVPNASTLAAASDSQGTQHQQLRVAIVDRPGAVQTVVRFAMPAPAYADSGRAARSLLNTLFGGSFTSRLNQNLREKNGYTYGARSSFTLARTQGAFVASSSIRADVTGPAIAEFLKEFDSLRSGTITPGELTKSRETVRNDIVEGFQGLPGILAAASRPIAVGEGYTTLASDLASLGRITTEELNALAASSVTLEQGVLVLVGDKAVILEQIRDLPLPAPVEYDAFGEPIKP